MPLAVGGWEQHAWPRPARSIQRACRPSYLMNSVLVAATSQRRKASPPAAQRLPTVLHADTCYHKNLNVAAS